MDPWNKQIKRGQKYLEAGDYSQAFKAFYHAIESDASHLEGWVYFANALRYLEIKQPNALLKKTIVECLAKPIANHQDIAFASLSMLKQQPEIQKLLKLQALSNAKLDAVNDPLLLALMEKTIIGDAAFERMFTHVRRLLVSKVRQIDTAHALPFVQALAKQCELNEYVYGVTPEELAQIKTWTKPYTPLQQALITCYRPKHSHADVLAKISIPTWGSISDTISQKVQAQYEENPYPRWTNLNPIQATTIPAFIKHRFPFAAIDKKAFSPKPNVLVAGCGTGQHAFNTARQFKNCKMLALDLSRSSLAYASQKAQELGLDNIHFLQADILELNGYPERYDLIECTGVLHHMAQPIEGWRVLKNLLLPHGVMHIGLYSHQGRQDIDAARQFLGTQSDIRHCRQLLLELPEDHLAKEVTHTLDFYTTSGCRDLLFHVQELRFTLPQIADILNALGLEFLGFDFRDLSIKKQYAARFPEDERMTALDLWDQFETEHPRTFSGMYQFWLKNK